MTKIQTQTLDRDKLMMLDRSRAASAAFEVLHPLQNLGPEEMAAGVSVLFAAVTTRVGLDPEEMFHLGRKVLTADEPFARTNQTLQSLRDFAGIRIKGDAGTTIA